MGLDLQINLPENSPAAHAVRRFAEAERITPEEAVSKLVLEAAEFHERKSPAEEMWGAFSSPEDQAMLDEIVAEAYERRLQDMPRDFGA